jgi:hypothetical protein
MRNSLILLFILVSFNGSAQLYKSMMGLRLDDSRIGLSYTQRVLPEVSLQVYGDLASTFVQSGFVARKHMKIAGRRLNWYPIAGVHAGFFKDFGGFSGVDIGIGGEYKFILAPVAISFDLVPSVHIGGSHPEWWTMSSMFTIHFILVKDKKVNLPKRKESDDD